MKVQLEGSLSMELTGAPPARLATGKTLSQPMTVTLMTSGKGNAATESKDLNGVWAYVSLVSADRRESLAPPREDLLRGRKANSIRLISREFNGKGQAIGTAEFSDLAVLQPGRYCFRINIVGMSRSTPGNGESGKILPALHTNPFDVV